MMTEAEDGLVTKGGEQEDSLPISLYDLPKILRHRYP